MCSFSITPAALVDKVLVHLVFSRYKVSYVKLRTRERVSHLIIHDDRNLSASSSSLFDKHVLLGRRRI